MSITCHFCGTEANGNGFEFDGKRHWLVDCRPDLVEHEPGDLCTWPLMEYGGSWSNDRVDQYNRENNLPNCYAYQDRDTREWGTEHKHFWSDGPC